MVEYALLAALVAVVAIGAITLLGERTSNDFDSAATGFGTASESPSTGDTGGGGGGTTQDLVRVAVQAVAVQAVEAPGREAATPDQ